MTAIYSFRLLEQVFWSNYTGFKNILMSRAKPTNLEMLVLLILCCLSLTSGYLFKDLFIGFGSNYFSNLTSTLPSTHTAVESEFIAIEIKILPLLFTAIAFEFENKLFECK